MASLDIVLADYYDGHACTLYARGTTALYVLFSSIREAKGHGEIIIPAICCETVAQAALYAGMQPIIADVESDTLCLSFETVVEKLSTETKAVVLVYIFGNTAIDHEPFRELHSSHDIIIIEDVAQAVGGHINGVPVGQQFDFTLLSFDHTKILRGHGGALVHRKSGFDDVIDSFRTALPPTPSQPTLDHTARSCRNMNHALFDLHRADPHTPIASAFRAIQPYYKDLFIRSAGVDNENRIIEQFGALDEDRSRRRQKYEYYRQHIHNEMITFIDFPPEASCWRMPLLISNPSDTFYLTERLRENGILASNHYFPLDSLLYDQPNPNSSYINSRILNLWVDGQASMEKVDLTVSVINTYRSVGVPS